MFANCLNLQIARITGFRRIIKSRSRVQSIDWSLSVALRPLRTYLSPERLDGQGNYYRTLIIHFDLMDLLSQSLCAPLIPPYRSNGETLSFKVKVRNQ